MRGLRQRKTEWTAKAVIPLTPIKRDIKRSQNPVNYMIYISYETVRSHVKKIYEKLPMAFLTEVVAKAINKT
jgi:hypothetical protein